MTRGGGAASIAVAPLLLLGLGAGVWLAPALARGGGLMADTDPRLLGAWDRTADAACAAQYAAHLRFEPNGLYFGTTEPPGGFTWWDGGTWTCRRAGPPEPCDRQRCGGDVRLRYHGRPAHDHRRGGLSGNLSPVVTGAPSAGGESGRRGGDVVAFLLTSMSSLECYRCLRLEVMARPFGGTTTHKPPGSRLSTPT